MKMDTKAENPQKVGVSRVEEPSDALVVFKVTKLDCTKNESTYECASIRELRFELAVECSTLYPCIKLYTKHEQRDVEDWTEMEKLGTPPISLYYIHSNEDVIPYLAEDWEAEDWLSMLEHHISQRDDGAVERLKPWVQGGTLIKAKMEAMHRSLILTRAEEKKNENKINIIIRLGINAFKGMRSKETMFHRAVEMRHVDVVRAFISAGVDVNCAKARIDTPLVVAIRKGRVDLVELLLGAGACPMRSYEYCPLYIAIDNAQRARGTKNSPGEIIRLLLEAKADVNWQGPVGGTALHAVAKGGDVALIRSLLEAKAEMNVAEGKSGITPLHYAAGRASPEIALFLLQHNADIHAKTSGGRTPITFAAQLHGAETIVALLRHNADPNVTDSRGRTPLFYAAATGCSEPALTLLDHGVDVNATDSSGSIALHHAAATGSNPIMLIANPSRVEIIRTLILNGSNLNTARTKNGATPLHCAAERGMHGNCIALMENGADKNVRNNRHQRPVDVASDVCTRRVLLSHGM